MGKNHNSIHAALILIALALLTASASAQMNNGVMSPPANTRPPRLENVGIEQRLDAQVPSDLTFRDETGSTVKLGDYFGHKPMILNLDPIAPVFSQPDLIAAIRGAQADTVRYPDFVKRSTAAGVIGYWAFLTGKQVAYFGRKGETLVEYFPGAKPSL